MIPGQAATDPTTIFYPDLAIAKTRSDASTACCLWDF